VGLSISRRIIESHGGELTVRRNEAGGATFTFTLPLMTEAAVELS
jgi:two-component system sensor kinase FixL